LQSAINRISILLFQWGVKDTSTTAVGNTEIVSSITFPTVFPNNNFISLATANGNNSTAGGQDILNITTQDASGFTCRLMDRTSNGTCFERYNWLAIGV